MNIIQYNAEQIPQKYSQIFNLPFQITEGTKVAYDFVHKKLKLRYFEPLVHTGTSSRKLSDMNTAFAKELQEKVDLSSSSKRGRYFKVTFVD